jgi:hypothetical protein
MGRSRSNVLRLAVAIVSLWSVGGCGGGTKAGPPLFPSKVNLNPGNNLSVELGATFGFSSSAQAGSTNLSTAITYSSSDTSILNVAPNGFACAGHWDVNFTTCTPGGTGAAQVTASALGASSAPTWVFVHPPVDNIIVTGVLLDNVPIQEPCLSQSQSMTVEAHAFSQGTDVTSSVGPFTWSAQNQPVVTLTPLVNTAYNFATNQATATAVTPGMTQIYASASGASSSSFRQPQYKNSQQVLSPVLDFFETCPIQTVTLELGATATQQTSQTSFATSKGTSQNATAVVTDIMGNTSLPNTNNGVVLTKIPLTWSGSQPGVVTPTGTCLQSCTISTPSPGSGSVTAACSPPSCNVGFPFVPESLSTPAALTTCTDFFKALFPAGFSCQQLIPAPVYATVLQPGNPPPSPPIIGNGAISGLVTGLPSAASVLATSTGCAQQTPTNCTTSIYSLSTGKSTPGPENPLPSSPNSLLFDAAGDKAFMGSNFGALLINPASFGTSNPYTGLDTVTGKVLAAANNGSAAVFSDTIHSPNQVYVVNTLGAGSLSASALNISQAVTAAFTPDGLKTFIAGDGGNSLYIYSSLQALQGPGLQGPGSNPQLTLSGPANAIAFSPNGAFAFVAASSTGTTSANLTAFNTCNNQIATDKSLVPATVLLPANPLFMRVLPGLHLEGHDSSGIPIPDGVHVLVLDATGFDVLTSNIFPPASGTLCPQLLTFNPAQRVELGQGTLQPLNFFTSADDSQLYVVAAGHASILVYDFGAGSVTSGIELAGNATPVSADMSPDAGTIVIAGSDGLLHEVSTGLGGSDQLQLSFPNLPNYLNPFCTAGPCTLNLLAVRP